MPDFIVCALRGLLTLTFRNKNLKSAPTVTVATVDLPLSSHQPVIQTEELHLNPSALFLSFLFLQLTFHGPSVVGKIY